MADNLKSSQRAELHKTIWRVANDLRGSVDGWGFEFCVASRSIAHDYPIPPPQVGMQARGSLWGCE